MVSSIAMILTNCIPSPSSESLLSPPATSTTDEVRFHNLDHFLANVEKRAFRMAQMATGHNEEALDIVQDAMLTLARKYADKPAKQWPPLFHRILQNRIRDWYRYQGVRNRFRGWLSIGSPSDSHDANHDIDPIQTAPDPRGLDPEHHASNDDHRQAILDAVAQLPLRQQQTFMLRIWEGLDVAQTAEAMNVSQGSIKTHLSRALHSLREQLADIGYTP